MMDIFFVSETLIST